MKKYLLLGLLFLMGCGDGNGGGGSSSSGGNTPAVATHLNGTWKLSQFACLDSTLTNQTYSSVITNFHEHTLVLSGSNIHLTINSTNCLVTYTGTISYNSNYMSLSTLTVQSATNNLCSQSYQMPTGITPNAVFVNQAPGNQVAGFTNAPYLNQTRLWIRNSFSNGTAGDVCFDLYDKQ